jgi:hypothetical protein
MEGTPMAKDDPTKLIEPTVLIGDLQIEQNDLLQPYYSFLLSEPVVLKMPNGTMIMLPSFERIYLANTVLGVDFRSSVRDIASEAKYLEETRIAKMTKEERDAWLMEWNGV